MRIDRPTGDKSQLTGSFSGSFYGVGNFETLNVTNNATIGGELTVAGKITAIEYHNTVVSSSIIYSQGSSKFGNSADDKHSFTGSLNVIGGVQASQNAIVGGRVSATSITGALDWSNIENVTLPSAQIFIGDSTGIAQARSISTDATITNTGALTISNNVVTDAKLRQSAGFSVIGKSTTGTGNVADIVAGSNGVLRRSGTGNLEFGTIVTGNITDANVTTAKIADSNVTTAKIADSNVTTAKILDANVTTAKLADSSVTTIKIADGNVTTAKILDANVTTAKIADSNVTTAKIADSNVTTAKIADSNVTTGKIANDAVSNDKLANMAVNTIKGRISAGTGDPEDLTPANVRTIINVADGANNYVHPTGFSSQPAAALTGANVISQVTVNGEGHVTGVTTRAMTAADLSALTAVNLGYTAAAANGTITNSGGTTATIPLVDTTNAGLMSPGDKTKLNGVATGANNYVHPSGFSSQPAAALTGANVISQITVNGEGHTTGVTSRALTLADLSYAVPNLQAVTNAGASTTNSITAANFITTSDRRVKSEITNIENPFETLGKINSYEYIKDGKKEAGFIAQEVQDAIPYAVFEGDNGMLTMSDRPILAYLFAAVMELKEENKLLKEKLGL